MAVAAEGEGKADDPTLKRWRVGIVHLVSTVIAMENHHFLWENPIFLLPFSIAMLVYQRVVHLVSTVYYTD